MLPKTLNHNMYVESDLLKMGFKKVLPRLTVLEINRQKAKSIIFQTIII
jgi:hypothetical protein